MKKLKKSWQWLKDKTDGKKLWSAIIGAITLYGVPWCRAKWPYLPWDEVLIPLLVGLGLLGAGHKIEKRIQKNGALFTLLILLMLAPIAFAMRPGEVKAVNLTKPRNLTTITETITSIEPATVSFALSLTYAVGSDSVPLYIGLSTAQGYTGYKYSFSLVNAITGKAVFRDEQTTIGRIASRKVKAWVKPPYNYTLVVSAPASIRYRDWLQLIRYSPPLRLDVGPYRSQQVDEVIP